MTYTEVLVARIGHHTMRQIAWEIASFAALIYVIASDQSWWVYVLPAAGFINSMGSALAATTATNALAIEVVKAKGGGK